MGAASSTIFVTARSALSTVMSAVSLLSAAAGSAWSAAVTPAVLVMVVPLVPASTVAVKVSVALTPFKIPPTVQTPVPLT